MRAAVIGAGFAGLVVANILADLGYSVTLYEEHDRVGYPPHCTGIVSKRVVDIVGKPAREAILGSYDEIIFRYKGKEERITINEKIYKLDRELLERLMLEEVISKNVSVKLKNRVRRVDFNGKVEVNSTSYNYEIVFLAEGHRRSLMRQSLGINYKPIESVGVNIEVRVTGLEEDTITVVFDEKLVGRGFYWIVPIGEDKAVVGALSLDRGKVVAAAERLALSMRGTELRRYGGVVIHGPPLKRNPLGRVVIVGDAAGFNKPLTGGGLYPNSLFAKILRETGNAGVAARLVARRLSKQYPLGRTLLENPKLAGVLVEIASEYGLGEAMKGRIDFDEHESLVSALLKSPSLLAKIVGRLVVKSPLGAVRLLAAGVKSLINLGF